jgi:hypothetical protein
MRTGGSSGDRDRRRSTLNGAEAVEVKATLLARGLHCGEVLAVGSVPVETGEISWRWVPSALAVQIWLVVPLKPYQAIWVPSGDHSGEKLVVGAGSLWRSVMLSRLAPWSSAVHTSVVSGPTPVQTIPSQPVTAADTGEIAAEATASPLHTKAVAAKVRTAFFTSALVYLITSRPIPRRAPTVT